MTPKDERPDAWLGEILGQPAAMERAAMALAARPDLLAALAAACRPGAPIVLTGMGSSAAACAAAATVLGGAGVLATPIETAELLHFRLPALAAAGTLVIVSQSGAGAELVRLLDALGPRPARPLVFGVANGIANPLSRRADIAFDTAAGSETGPSSGTFAATLVTLAGIVRALAGGPSADAPRIAAEVGHLAGAAARALAEVLADAPPAAAAIDAAFAGRSHRVILGRGTARPAADMGALTLKEGAALGCEAQDSAAFRHGPLELAGPNLGAVIISLDREGAFLCRRGQQGRKIPHQCPRSVYDVTGAGDETVAALAVALAENCSYEQAEELANVAGGLEVEQFGFVPITRDQIVTELRRMIGLRGQKVLDRERLAAEIARRRQAGQTIVFTNGCFDLLHMGHVNYLQQARELGSCLIVAINSDASVRRLKGPSRPVIGQAERAGMLAALECVDYVTIFDEDTPMELLELLRPDVLVKGGTTPVVVGRELVESYGGRVTTMDLVAGLSTTQIINRIVDSNG